MAHPIYEALAKVKANGETGHWTAERRESMKRETSDRRTYTARELRFAYECVCNPDNFKGPFVTTIAPSMLELVSEAIHYFTNRRPDVRGVDHQSGRLIIESPGQ